MPGPAGRHHVERVVLVGGEPDGGRLHPQRHVLGDQHDLAPPVGAALGGQVERAGQDAASLASVRNPAGSTSGSVWLSSTCSVPARVPIGTGASSRPCSMRRSSSVRSAVRANHPSSGWCRLPSSSEITTSGRTTSCSVEPGQRPRVGQQNRGVEHVAAGVRAGAAVGSITGAPSWARHHAHSPVGRPALARTSATPPRTPARAGCRPSRVHVTPRPGPPGRSASGTSRRRKRYRRSPGCGQLQRVSDHHAGRPELTQRTTVRR